MSKLTQISLDFGEEPQSPPVPPPAGSGTGEDPVRSYLAASGVGVRVKSFKQPVSPPPSLPTEMPEDLDMPARPMVRVVNGDLFGTPVPENPEEAPAAAEAPELEPMEEAVVAEEPVVVEEPVIEAPVVAEPEPVVVEQAPAVAPAAAEAGVEPAPRRRTPPGKGIKQPSKRGRKSLKQVAAEADLIEIPADEVLFSKQYYTMGEVAGMFQVNQSLLRFWETEFDILQPKKNKKGDRYFRPIDIKNLHLIYHLLRQKKYTIEGAKDFLKKNKKVEDRFEVIKRLEEIKAFLVEWKAQL